MLGLRAQELIRYQHKDVLPTCLDQASKSISKVAKRIAALSGRLATVLGKLSTQDAMSIDGAQIRAYGSQIREIRVQFNGSECLLVSI